MPRMNVLVYSVVCAMSLFMFDGGESRICAPTRWKIGGMDFMTSRRKSYGEEELDMMFLWVRGREIWRFSGNGDIS